jgi:cadmium resistance protein CadD (predicted permease)
MQYLTHFNIVSFLITFGNLFLNIYLFYLMGKQSSKIECLNKIIEKYHAEN